MFIYEIYNSVNGKKYIGQTTRQYTLRWSEHRYNLYNNKHPNSKLQRAWNKYGSDVFKFNIVRECSTLEELNTLEEQYVLNNKNGYNLLNGGNNKHWSYESRKKLSTTKKGKPNGQKGTKRTPLSLERKLKLSMSARPSGYADLVDPNGILHKVYSVKTFAQEHNIWFSGLRTLFAEKPCFHYKGWRLATKDSIGVNFSDQQYDRRKQISKGRRPNGFPSLLNPSGEICIVEDTLTSFCKNHKLNTSSVSNLINKKITSYKGWTLYKPTEN